MHNKMVSHNKDRPSNGSSTRANYSAFYERLEKAFSPEELNEKDLAEWLRNPSHPFIDVFMRVKQVDQQISESQDLDSLQELESEISTFPIHRSNIREKLQERIREIKKVILEREEKERKIAQSIYRLNSFAEKRGITLSEKTYGREYQKWGRYHRPARVIFKSGKIFAWEYI